MRGRSLHVGHKALLSRRCIGLRFFFPTLLLQYTWLLSVIYLFVVSPPILGVIGLGGGKEEPEGQAPPPLIGGVTPAHTPTNHTQSLANPLMGRLRDLHHAMRGAGRTGTVA